MVTNQSVHRAITALHEVGSVTEFRVPKAGKYQTVSGYFDEPEKLACAVAEWSGQPGVEGVYYTLNPVKPSLLARANNRTKTYAKATTSDNDILKRRWLLIDVDPARPSGVSASDEEKLAARVKTRHIGDWLKERGLFPPIPCDSGNGFHLLYRIDLPNDKESTELIRKCLLALAAAFDDDIVKVDTTVFNASRIIKAYGSLAAKGDSTADRPHRVAGLFKYPSPVQVNGVELLLALAAEAPSDTKKSLSTTSASKFSGKISPEKIEEFLKFYGIEHGAVQPYQSGYRWILRSCPFNDDHAKHTDTCVFLFENGPRFKCSHNGCSENQWKAFRAKLEKDANGAQFPLLDRKRSTNFDSPEPSFYDTAFDEDDDDAAAEYQSLVVAEASSGSLQSSVPIETSQGQQPSNALDMPADCLYGWLGEKAQTLQAPIGWAYPSLLAVFSGQGINMHSSNIGVRPTVYVCLIGDKGDGKSLTMRRAKDSLLYSAPQNIKSTVPGSDRGLFNMFKSQKRKAKASNDEESFPELKSYLLMQDEFKGTLQKMSIQGSNLPTTLCSLFYEDDAGSADKTGEHSVHIRLSILGALKAGDATEFGESFGSQTTAGLYDRFLFGIAPKGWKWNHKWFAESETRLPKSVTIPSECYDVVDNWREVGKSEGKDRGRIGELALRVAVITSSANHESTVTQDCLRKALGFMEWQERIRSAYQAGVAETIEGRITACIIDALDAHRDQDGKPAWVRFWPLARKKNWGRKFGSPSVTRTKEALIKEGTIVEEVEITKDSDGQDKPEKTGRVRVRK